VSDLLFDEADDVGEPIIEASNFLVVPGTPDPEQLNEIEQAYRRAGRPRIIFEDEDGNLENAREFAQAMGLKRLPTLEEAERFVLDGTLPEST
jgi:hypothetical protein